MKRAGGWRTLNCGVISIALIGASSACGQGSTTFGTAQSKAALRLLGDRGTSLSGVILNPVALGLSDEVILTGVTLHGSELDGSDAFHVNGKVLRAVSLNAIISPNGSPLNQFSAVVDDRVWSGKDFGGAIMLGQLSNGGSLRLRIDGVASGYGPKNELMLYSVAYETKMGWLPLCGADESGTPVLALPLSGLWNHGRGVEGGGSFSADPDHFTFACRDRSAIAKCVELGYVPYKQIRRERFVAWTEGSLLGSDVGRRPNDRTMAEHHAACTRMLRADYCGDGTAWTPDRTWSNVVDGAGIHSEYNEWGLEAEWDANGARCTADPHNARFSLMGSGEPACFSKKLRPNCGAGGSFTKGTVLINQYDGDGRFAHIEGAGGSAGESSVENPLAAQIEIPSR